MDFKSMDPAHITLEGPVCRFRDTNGSEVFQSPTLGEKPRTGEGKEGRGLF